MGSASNVHFLLLGVLFIIVAWNGEHSLSKGPGSWVKYPCGGWGYGERSLCSVPLANSALHRSGFRWGELPITMLGRLGALPISKNE
jgi:hypothetical protein